MKSRSRKLTAGVIIVLGVAVLMGAAASSWDRVLEQLYLWRLGSEDPARRDAAAARLIELGSVQVVPFLIEKFGETTETHGIDGAMFNGTPLMDTVNSRGADPQESRWGHVSPEFYRLQSVLLEIARRQPAAAEYFIAGLENERAPTRALCAFLLSETGAQNEEARLAARSLLKDTDLFVRTVAVVALGRMGPESAPMLVEALADHGNRVRAAVWALEEIGAPAVPHLIVALKSGKGAVRNYAVYVLGQIGEPARAGIPALAEVLKDETTGAALRARTAVALRRIGGQEAALEEFTRTEDHEVRGTVEETLDGVQGEAPRRPRRSTRRFR